MTFGNRTFFIHISRGVGGLALVLLSVRLLGHPYAWLAFLLMPAALWLLKGCPICWTVGVFEMLAARIHRTGANAG